MQSRSSLFIWNIWKLLFKALIVFYYSCQACPVFYFVSTSKTIICDWIAQCYLSMLSDSWNSELEPLEYIWMENGVMHECVFECVNVCITIWLVDWKIYGAVHTILLLLYNAHIMHELFFWVVGGGEAFIRIVL